MITVVLTDVVSGGDFRTRLLTATFGGCVTVANKIQAGERGTQNKDGKRTGGLRSII